MKRDFLLPHSWKKWGWIVTVPSVVFALCMLFGLEPWFGLFDSFGGFVDEIVMTFLTAGLLMVAFSREKDEDEYTARLRTSSLVWAVVANYVLLVVFTWAVYDLAYLNVVLLNMFTPLVLYIVKFNIAVARARNTAGKGE